MAQRGTGSRHGFPEIGGLVMDRKHPKLTPSMVISCVALFVALSGAAVAGVTLSNNTVRSNNIVNGQVKNADLATNSVGRLKIKDGAVTSAKIRDGAVEPVDLSPATISSFGRPTAAWSASIYDQITNVTTGGPVAHLTFESPAAGFVVVDAAFATRVRNFQGGTNNDCRVSAQVASTAGAPAVIDPGATSAPGYVDQWINGNLPTQNGAGTYLGRNQSVTRVLPVVAGSNTVYLNGRHSCQEVFWGPITMTAIWVQLNPSATLTRN
jgi:hypothetical protein